MLSTSNALIEYFDPPQLYGKKYFFSITPISYFVCLSANNIFTFTKYNINVQSILFDLGTE